MRKIPSLVIAGVILLFGGFGCIPSVRPVPVPVPVPAPAPGLTTPPSAASAQFGTAASVAVGDTLSYEDGLAVTLERVNDSRCPEGVQCIWQGELAPVLLLRGGDIGPAGKELILGTVRARTASEGAYAFSLADASAGSATITVTKPVTGLTGVRGTVTIGPTCPVERVPPDPSCAPKPYATTLRITGAAGSKVADVTVGADGKFAQALPPGDYVIGPATAAKLPRLAERPFAVAAGKMTALELMYDSGIR